MTTSLLSTMLRLKSRLLVNMFRRSPWQIVGIVIGLVYGAMVTIVAVGLLAALRFAPVQLAATIVEIGGSIIVLAFLVVPLLAGIDDTLDPRRFALFGIEQTRLALGLLVTGLLSVPSVVVLLIAATTIVTWSRAPGAAVAALICVPLVVATTALFGRLSAAGAGLLLATRRARERLAAVGLLMLIALSVALVIVSNVEPDRGFAQVAVTVATILSFTPLGAAWAVPATIAAGDPAWVLQLAVAIAVPALLWFAWRAVLGRMLVTPPRAGRVAHYSGLGWFGRLPATPLWSITARSLTYWNRDLRYGVSVAMVPVTPLLMVLALAVAGVPGPDLALIPVPVVALFLGWIGHNDVAYDSTAIWLHVVSGTRGVADRLGRAMPMLLIGVPIVVVAAFVCAHLSGRNGVVMGLLGVSSGLLLTGFGLSFVSSARFPYPVPKPGASPFQQPNATGGITAAVQSVTFLAQFVVATPAIVFAVLGLVVDPAWFPASLASGVVLGGAVFAIGLRVGSRVFERRGPEIVAAAVRA